jgi:hypothetical protein
LDLPVVSKLNSNNSSVTKPILDHANRSLSAGGMPQHDIDDELNKAFDLDDSLNCSTLESEEPNVQDKRVPNVAALNGVNVSEPHVNVPNVAALNGVNVSVPHVNVPNVAAVTVANSVSVPYTATAAVPAHAETGIAQKDSALTFPSGSPLVLPPTAVPAKSNLLESLLSDPPAHAFAASPPHPPAVPVKAASALINSRSVSPIPFKPDSTSRSVSPTPFLANSSQTNSASRIPVFDGTSWKIRSGATTPQRTEASPLRAHPSEVQLKKTLIEPHSAVKAPLTYALPTRKVSDSYSKDGSRTVSPSRGDSLTEGTDASLTASQSVLVPFEAGPEPFKTKVYTGQSVMDTPALTGPQTAKGEVLTFDAHTGEVGGVEGLSGSEGNHLTIVETTSSGPSSTTSSHSKMPQVGPALKLNLYGSADQIPTPLNPAFSKPNSPIACNWTPPKPDILPVIAVVTDGKTTPTVGSRPVSAAYSRPVSANSKTVSATSRPGSATSRPVSAVYNRPGSAKNSRPVSAVGSRPVSAKGSRPVSAAYSRPLSASYSSKDMPPKPSPLDILLAESPARSQGNGQPTYPYDGSETVSVGELKKTFEQTPPEVRERKKLLGGTLTPRMPVAITVPISRHDSITSDTDSPKNSLGLERCLSNSKIIMARTPNRNILCAEPAVEVLSAKALAESDLDYAGYDLGGQLNEEEEEIG